MPRIKYTLTGPAADYPIEDYNAAWDRAAESAVEFSPRSLKTTNTETRRRDRANRVAAAGGRELSLEQRVAFLEGLLTKVLRKQGGAWVQDIPVELTGCEEIVLMREDFEDDEWRTLERLAGE